MKNRIFALFLALFYTVGISQTVFARTDIIKISSVDDFNGFSNKCILDEWSQGKNAELVCDLDFSDCEFLPIATFGGNLDGKGHKISGVDFSKKGSCYGLFRYLQKDGKILNLKVEGNFAPGGSKSHIGAIVGENSGTIENCTFEGSVKGKNIIGGIAGENTESGRIINCAVSGTVIGESFTGGVAGQNEGFISGCTNNSSVNTVYEEKKKSLPDIETDKGALIDNYRNKEEEQDGESVLGHTDTGGIAGFSSGIIEGCVNNGEIGYTHVGYNVGGIAGRQSGYMLGCENYGVVCGRKDVGGIVGQAEPYILLSASEGSLRNLKTELNTLNTLVNRFITDGEDFADTAGGRADRVSDYVKSARESTETLLNSGTDFVNDNIAEVNAQAAILSNTLDKLVPVCEELETGCEDLSAALDEISLAFDGVDLYAPELLDEFSAVSAAAAEISIAEKSIKAAVARFRRAVSNLEDAVTFKNTSAVKKALSEMSEAGKNIIKEKQKIKNSLEEIEKILNQKPEDFEAVGANAKLIAANIKQIRENTSAAITAMETISNGLDTLILNSEIDTSEFSAAARNISAATGYLGDATHYISKGLTDLTESLGNLYDKLYSYAEDMNEEINTAADSLSHGFSSLSYAAEDIKSAVGKIGEIVEDLSEEDEIEFVKLNDDFKDASENLFDSLSGISEELNGLKDAAARNGKSLRKDLEKIGNQFNLVMNLLVDDLKGIADGAQNLADTFLDASDEDIEKTRQGKIAECRNFAAVSADRNTGGVAGALAIEYLKDPEGDIERPSSLNFTYRTKAILQECINDGEITGKKDCVGGILGDSEIGTVYKCENYGDVTGTDGNYVGGVVGKSESSVYRCLAKCALVGKRFVGGIAGKAKVINASYSIVNVSGDENVGAICGSVEGESGLYRNFYVPAGTGASDGVSYRGKAEPISFEELKMLQGIPKRFISFSVTFVADGETVDVCDIRYGDATAKIKYPKIPEKEGYFGKWQKPEAETVTENLEVVCEYKPYITVLSSEEKNENGKLSLALCEGEFTDEAVLHVDRDTKVPGNPGGEAYRISILNSDIGGTDSVALRFLNEKGGRTEAWRLTDGEWKKIKTRTRGKYVLLEGVGSENIISVKCEESTGLWAEVSVLAMLSAAVLGAIIMFKKRGRFKDGEKNMHG